MPHVIQGISDGVEVRIASSLVLGVLIVDCSLIPCMCSTAIDC
jgi:hypothetical protein